MKYRGIVLAGVSEVGKSEVARFLEREYSLKKFHVKSLLGEMIAPLLIRLGVPVDELPDYIFGDKINGSLPLDQSLTTRLLLQKQGGEFLASLPDPNIAVRLSLDEFHPAVALVSESCRYAREAGYLQSRGFYVTRIIRPDNPSAVPNTHMSENDQTFDVDAVYVNNSTLDRMFEYYAALAESLGFQRVAQSKRNRQLVIVNGRPKSGKDTIVESMIEYAREMYGDEVIAYSSIDPIRDLCYEAGIDVSRKTDEDRHILCELGKILHRWRVERTFRHVDSYLNARVAFVYAREPNTISMLRELGNQNEFDCSSLWIARPSDEHYQPPSTSDDISQDDTEYEFMFSNDGSLSELHRSSGEMYETIVGAASGHVSARRS